MHLMDLAAEVKKGVEEIGLVGFRFNTIGMGVGRQWGVGVINWGSGGRWCDGGW